MRTTHEPFVFRLRRARRMYDNGEGLTLEEAARLAGVTSGSVHRYERMSKLPAAIEILLRLARAYQVSLDQLVSDIVDDKVKDEIEDRRSNHVRRS